MFKFISVIKNYIYLKHEKFLLKSSLEKALEIIIFIQLVLIIDRYIRSLLMNFLCLSFSIFIIITFLISQEMKAI
jgi:hypothetical protein